MVRVRLMGREVSLAVTEEQAAEQAVARRSCASRSPGASGRSSLLRRLGRPSPGWASRSWPSPWWPALSWPSRSSAWPSSALSLRSARGFGGFQRGLARGLLGEEIEDPEPFASRPGFLGWLQSSLRDRRPGGRWPTSPQGAAGPCSASSSAFSLWWDAFVCLTHPILAGTRGSNSAFGSSVREPLSPGILLGRRRGLLPQRRASSSLGGSSSSPRRGPYAGVRQCRPRS